MASQPLAEEGIRVNCICPTYTETPLLTTGMMESDLFRAYVQSQGTIPFAEH